MSKANVGIDGIVRGKDRDLEISQNVAQVFNSPTWAEVLRYLRSITIEMVHGPNADDATIRHQEGQRYIVAMIERRIDHAHRSKE